jgi:hypothetical protein
MITAKPGTALHAVQRFLRDRDVDRNMFEAEAEALVRVLDKNFGYEEYRYLGKGCFASTFLVQHCNAFPSVLKITMDMDDINSACVVRDNPGISLATIYAAGFTPVRVNWNWYSSQVISTRIGIIIAQYYPYPALDFPGNGALGLAVRAVKRKHMAWIDKMTHLSAAEVASRVKAAQSDLIKILTNKIKEDGPQKLLSAARYAAEGLRERGLYCVDLHAGNFGATVSKPRDPDDIHLYDFGVGGFKRGLRKKITPAEYHTTAVNPPAEESIDDPVLVRTDTWPFVPISPARGVPQEFGE